MAASPLQVKGAVEQGDEFAGSGSCIAIAEREFILAKVTVNGSKDQWFATECELCR